MITETYIRKWTQKDRDSTFSSLVKVYRLNTGTLVMEKETGKGAYLAIITQEQFDELEVI